MKESRGITPLRTILRNCLNHIENLETNRSICDNYDKEFQDLKQFSETLKAQKEFACTEGEKEVNRKKNRYKDILPFNVSRVILNEYAGVPGSDYINANFIKGASGSPAYIASQGPLPNTVNDFWRMVVECEVQVIVMACNAQESGKHKCENYWVEKEGEEKRFGMVQICLVKASLVCPDFLVRTMRLKYTNDKDVTEERTVCQFHYSAWPDHGVPPLVRPLLDMVRLVRDTQASETLPVLVHCSAGCGRTGTICAIDFVWGLLRAGKLTEEFSLFNLVRDMRKQRVAMVQTKEQYILVHQAVRELFKEQLRVIESHPYENIDFNGVPLIKDFEEPFYDTINVQNFENCDEKQDKSDIKEKAEDSDIKNDKIESAPPLPRKKRPNVLFSKQEKEAENLTEKNRLYVSDKDKEKSDVSHSGLLGKPRIVKLRALFEKNSNSKDRSVLKDRGSQTVSRSHSLGAFRKPLTSEIFELPTEKIKPSNISQQPVNDHNKLKHSKSFSKSVPLIKRSKSLKTFSPSLHLSVSTAVDIDHKFQKLYLVNHHENEISVKKENSNSKQKMDNTKSNFESLRDDSKRRRSLESLMGDLPPTITWPDSMNEEKNGNDLNLRQIISWSSKLNSRTIQDNKTADLIRLQLQRLSVETEKKVNNISSGIGTRERRNSFRQAVTKNEFQNVFCSNNGPSTSTKKPANDYFVVPYPKNNRNSADAIYYVDYPDSVQFSEREKNTDLKTALKVKSVYQDDKYKLNSGPINNNQKKSESKKQSIRQENSNYSSSHFSTPTFNHITSDSRVLKVMPIPKSKPREETDRNLESKNLFLKRLNSEILSEKERESGITSKYSDSHLRLSCEELRKREFSNCESEKSLNSSDHRFLSKTKSKSSGFNKNSENFDELDGLNNKVSAKPTQKEVKDKNLLSWSNSSLQNQQMNKTPQKHSKPKTDYSYYVAVKGSHFAFYNKPISPRKEIPYQTVIGEPSKNAKLDQSSSSKVLSRKEPARPIVHNISKAPIKGYPNVDNETISPVKEHRNFGYINSEKNKPINSDYDECDRKLLLPSKVLTVDKNVKTFDCLPWSHSTSSRSSGETSSSDQFSNKSDSLKLLCHYDNESVNKSEFKANKKEKIKKIGKINLNDVPTISKTGEQLSDPPKLRRESDSKIPSAECENQAAAAGSKSRQKSSKYSKDDFLIDEPTAPPRVKRHASVTIPRNNGNTSEQVSSWVSVENNLSSDKNAALEIDKNAWNGLIGVDLDAVAASMQQNKGESSTMKNRVWPGKIQTNVTSNPNFKKKQHYF